MESSQRLHIHDRYRKRMLLVGQLKILRGQGKTATEIAAALNMHLDEVNRLLSIYGI